MTISVLINQDYWTRPRLSFFANYRLDEKGDVDFGTFMWAQNLGSPGVMAVAQQHHLRVGQRLWDFSSQNSVWVAGNICDVAFEGEAGRGKPRPYETRAEAQPRVARGEGRSD